MESKGSWEQTKGNEEALKTYSLPRWYLTYGVWTWPLIAVLLIVIALSPAGERAGFAVSWGILIVVLAIGGHIAARNWPIS